ncbi:MAG: ABC transporter ATP-binding protein [Kiritimatiellae bacterium]|nr:ABC transporter ATP-binding protein [Kiritimatiellia bacterium]
MERNETPAAEAAGLCKAFGSGSSRTEVFKDFSFSLPRGAFEAVMGASGSGKSTLLHLLSGFVSADSGTVRVGGQDVTAMSDAAATRFRRRHVGMVFQSYNLVETIDVADNVALPVRLDRRKPDMRRLAALLDKLGLAGKERRLPHELSGGERQRVAIARALFAGPDVVFADEPTGNLDAAATRKICDMLRLMHEDGGRTAILLVTHDPVVAAAADRVHVLRDGVVAESFDTRHDPVLVASRYMETEK